MSETSNSHATNRADRLGPVRISTEIGRHRRRRRGPLNDPCWAALLGAHWVAVGLAAVAGAIQLSLAITDGLFLLVLPAAVLFAGVASAIAGVDRRLLYALGVPFVVAQLFAALMQDLSTLGPGVLAVSTQVALLGLLAYLLWQERTTDRTNGVRPRRDAHPSSH